MFTWNELNELACAENLIEESQREGTTDVIEVDNVRPEIRVVMNELEVHYDPLASYRAPIDTVDLASDEAGSNSFKDFMAMCAKPSELENENSNI